MFEFGKPIQVEQLNWGRLTPKTPERKINAAHVPRIKPDKPVDNHLLK